MARAGQALENPVTGERLTFMDTARDTGGELLRFELVMAPEGFVPFWHVHRVQEERFRPEAGQGRFRIGREVLTASAGETVVAPPGTPHSFSNPGDEDLRVIVEYRPALRTEALFETLFGLAARGKLNPKGRPKPLQQIVIAREYLDEVSLARPPFVVQRALLCALAPLGRLAGYRAGPPQDDG